MRVGISSSRTGIVFILRPSHVVEGGLSADLIAPGTVFLLLSGFFALFGERSRSGLSGIAPRTCRACDSLILLTCSLASDDAVGRVGASFSYAS